MARTVISMGMYYYLVIPDWKITVSAGRSHCSEDCLFEATEKWKNIQSIFEDTIYDESGYEIQYNNIFKLSLWDLSMIGQQIKEYWNIIFAMDDQANHLAVILTIEAEKNDVEWKVKYALSDEERSWMVGKE